MRQLLFASWFGSIGSVGGRKASIVPLKVGMEVRSVPILSDNYSYLLIDRQKNVAAVVDPADPKKILAAVEEEGVKLTTILTTHHHWDHAGGNAEMRKAMPDLRVYAPKDDHIASATDEVEEGDQVSVVGSAHTLSVLGTPCHTRGHVCYHSTTAEAVFTGDTLFVGGCGRFFEGTASQMLKALDKLGSLPPQTKIFCGHEYTVANLKFALSVEPENQELQAKMNWATAQRKEGLPTIPSTIHDELQYNPFMRTSSKTLTNLYGSSDPVGVMKQLREAKNSF
ncbi:hypothetical protein NDN08_002702 [Rhodosorus marinus]|uniref:hydroxyacylglutathione hydrolase n=1 Tax=Rhodosorus marinus TaxID=101924 RepID=A0AAV8UX57_9RHOD|nr:hypothetical protein NDN08_002702 [Rhodosorus marinus]